MSASGNGRGRANGEGSFYPHRNGWAAYVWVTTPTGKKDRKYIYGQVREKLYDRWVVAAGQGHAMPVPTKTPTVTEYLGLLAWGSDQAKSRGREPIRPMSCQARFHVIPGYGERSDRPKADGPGSQTWLNQVPATASAAHRRKTPSGRQAASGAARIGDCCGDHPSRRVIEGARNTLRAALNHAKREELVERNVAELVTLPKARKKLQRRNSWTVDEARRFLESSRRDNDPLYALWVLILVLGLRRGEAMGLVDDDSTIDEAAEEIGLEWQLGRVGGHPLTHKHQLKADGSVETLPVPPIVLAALRIARQMQAERRTARGRRSAFAASAINCCSPRAPASRSSRGTSSAALTRAARKRACGRSRFTTRAARAGHCWPRSTFTRASRWRFSGTAG